MSNKGYYVLDFAKAQKHIVRISEWLELLERGADNER